MALPTLEISVAFSVGAAESDYLVFDDTQRGKFDTGLFGPDELWTDVTPYGRVSSTIRGVSRSDGLYMRAEAGKMVATFSNADRRFDPTNLSGPYVSGGATQVTPMRGVRVRATYNSTVYDVWRGFADSWDLQYPSMAKDAIVVLTASDAVKVLANYDGPEQGSVGAGEDTGTRIGRLLDNANWPDTDRMIDTGQTTVQATTLAANTWTEMLLTSDTEIGELYIDAAGKVVFRDRHALLTDTRSNTSQATFGDDLSAGELPYADIRISYDDQLIRNTISIARAGGTAQTAEDVTSQNDYQKRTFTRTDLLMQTDAVALDYAQYVLGLFKDPEIRVEQLVIKPQGDPDNLFPQVLGREIGDRIRVKFTPPGGGDRIDRYAFIRGIEHQMTPADWVTTWTLQDATDTGVGSTLVFDNTILGRLDFNSFGY